MKFYRDFTQRGRSSSKNCTKNKALTHYGFLNSRKINQMLLNLRPMSLDRFLISPNVSILFNDRCLVTLLWQLVMITSQLFYADIYCGLNCIGTLRCEADWRKARRLVSPLSGYLGDLISRIVDFYLLIYQAFERRKRLKLHLNDSIHTRNWIKIFPVDSTVV